MAYSASERRDEHAPAGTVTLTVVIPHFNHSRMLPCAVASVVAEDGQDTEIIVVDDGSTDGSEEVLQALERAYPSVRVIRCAENKGAPAALNTGLAAAKGRYVSFLGADDFLMPGFRRAMIEALERYPDAALACSEVALLSSAGFAIGIRPLAVPALRETYLTLEDIRRLLGRTDNWIRNTAAVHRTDMIRAAGGFDPTIGAFCDGFVSRVLAFSHGFVFVPGVYGVWRVAASTLSAASILDAQEGSRLRALAEERLAGSIIGRVAPDYPDLFVRRLRFSAARMRFVWRGKDADPDGIVEAADGDERDRRLLGAIKRHIGFNRFGRVLALGWFAVRLRPFAPASIAFHLLRNRWILKRNRVRVQARLLELDTVYSKLMNRSG